MSAPSDSIKPRLKVLLVDDDSDLLILLSDIFEVEGYKVVTAKDGVDGSFKFANEIFDIVVTDIRMPKKDGIKFVQFIKATDAQRQVKTGEYTKTTPVLFISASLDDYSAEIGLFTKSAFLSKPFSSKDVIKKVNKLLEKTSSTGVNENTERCYKEGEFIIHEGDQDTDIYYVKDGSLQVLVKDKNEQMVSVATIKTGEIIGELGFLLRKPRTASVVALSDSILIPIPREKFDAVISAQPKWFKVLFETIALRLENTTKLLVEEKTKK
jgi:CRP-like cAMP-binding protein